MALKNIQPHRSVYCQRFFHEFRWKDTPGAGFTFPCDKDGNVELTEFNRENYEFCLTNTDEIINLGVQDHSFWDREPAHGTCDCGRKVWLSYDNGYGIGCDCGRTYNLSGQELAPMSQWEERMDYDDFHTVAEMNGGYDG
jgi:hypothetical protein